MSRHDPERLTDILSAIDAIHDHLSHGELSGGLVLDAVRVRLIEIGEAVKGTTPATLAMPDIPWADVAKMRDHLAHRYFDTTHAIVQGTVTNDLPALEDAVRRDSSTAPVSCGAAKPAPRTATNLSELIPDHALPRVPRQDALAVGKLCGGFVVRL